MHMPRPAERTLVTSAQQLRISDLKRAGVFARPREIHFLPLAPVPYSVTSVPLIACAAVPQPVGFSLALAHHPHHPHSRDQVMRYWVNIDAIPMHLGGMRYWFVCPGRDCPRALRYPAYWREYGDDRPPKPWRVTTLYLPPSTATFRCRYCRHLVYRTQQLHYDRSDAKSRDRAKQTTQELVLALVDQLMALPLARESLLAQLQAVVKECSEEGEEQIMPRPEITLRQRAVWYLWGLRRVPVKELAALFGVTVRTIARDLADLRERGWRRPRPGEGPVEICLELTVLARARLDAAFQSAYRELHSQKRRLRWKEMLARVQLAAMKQAELTLAASRLVRATQRDWKATEAQQREAMEQELAAALRPMLGR
jgi:hypothetical protein